MKYLFTINRHPQYNKLLHVMAIKSTFSTLNYTKHVHTTVTNCSSNLYLNQLIMKQNYLLTHKRSSIFLTNLHVTSAGYHNKSNYFYYFSSKGNINNNNSYNNSLNNNKLLQKETLFSLRNFVSG